MRLTVLVAVALNVVGGCLALAVSRVGDEGSWGGPLPPNAKVTGLLYGFTTLGVVPLAR